VNKVRSNHLIQEQTPPRYHHQSQVTLCFVLAETALLFPKGLSRQHFGCWIELAETRRFGCQTEADKMRQIPGHDLTKPDTTVAEDLRIGQGPPTIRKIRGLARISSDVKSRRFTRLDD
jgi:hypothetical protein